MEFWVICEILAHEYRRSVINLFKISSPRDLPSMIFSKAFKEFLLNATQVHLWNRRRKKKKVQREKLIQRNLLSKKKKFLQRFTCREHRKCLFSSTQETTGGRERNKISRAAIQPGDLTVNSVEREKGVQLLWFGWKYSHAKISG